MITNQRTEELARYLAEDKERMEVLLSMPAEKAVVTINSDGHNFTTDELVAFAGQICDLRMQDVELNEEDLDCVSGGGLKLKTLWWIVKNAPKALYIAWTAEPGKIRQK